MDDAGRKPTSATSEETRINVAKESMPWHAGADAGSSKDFKFVSPPSPHPHQGLWLIMDRYKYHPGGDARNDPKHAPSALHSVIIPSLNLPKVWLSFWNTPLCARILMELAGRDFTRSTISGARTGTRICIPL